MATVANKRSIMTLYSGRDDIYSHRVRMVLAEKGVAVDVLEIEDNNRPEELATLNPYNEVPTLVDRDLVLYESRIIMEYLDERFPHPPLLPVYPVARAKSRLMMHRIENSWYPAVEKILAREGDIEATRKEFRESLLSVVPVFAELPYFMSEEFSLVDCTIAPLLWRLPALDVVLPKQAKAIESYCERIFERESFQSSLTETEREIHQTV